MTVKTSCLERLLTSLDNSAVFEGWFLQYFTLPLYCWSVSRGENCYFTCVLLVPRFVLSSNKVIWNNITCTWKFSYEFSQIKEGFRAKGSHPTGLLAKPNPQDVGEN